MIDYITANPYQTAITAAASLLFLWQAYGWVKRKCKREPKPVREEVQKILEHLKTAKLKMENCTTIQAFEKICKECRNGYGFELNPFDGYRKFTWTNDGTTKLSDERVHEMYDGHERRLVNGTASECRKTAQVMYNKLKLADLTTKTGST